MFKTDVYNFLKIILSKIKSADVDECITGEHTCHSALYCKNTEGDYACDCPNGYRPNPNDAKRCLGK